MRFKGTFIALGILAGLVGWLYLVEFPREKKKEETEKKENLVFSFSRDDVVTLTLRKRGEAEIVVSRIEDEKDFFWVWRMESPVATYADRARVEDVLRELETLRKERALESSDFAAFGLDPPEMFVEAGLRGGGKISLALGADTPVENFAYARAGDANAVILVDRHARTALGKDAHALRERRTVPFEPIRLVRFEVRREKEVLKAEKSGERWNIVSPAVSPAENDAVENFLHVLESMTAASFPTERADASSLKAFGLDKPLFSVILTELRAEEERAVEASFAERGGKMYARRGFDGAVLEIENPRHEELAPSFEAFRRRKVFTFPKWDSKKIEAKASGGGWTLVKENWEWKLAASEAGKPDRMKAEDAASAAATLRAAGFLDSCGESEPFLEIRASGDDGAETAVFRRTPNGKVCASVEGWDAALLVDETALDIFLKPVSFLLEPSPPPDFGDEHGHEH